MLGSTQGQGLVQPKRVDVLWMGLKAYMAICMLDSV